MQAPLTAPSTTAATAGTTTTTPSSGPRRQVRCRWRETSTPAPGAQPPQPPGVAAPFTVPVSINGRFALALIDTGATGIMMSPLAASLYHVKVTEGPQEIAVTVADGSSHACARVALDVPLRMGQQGRTMRVAESFFVPEMARLPLLISFWACRGFRGGGPFSIGSCPCLPQSPPVGGQSASRTAVTARCRASRAESKKLLTSILMLKQAQRAGDELLVARAGDELLVAHVRPAADSPAHALGGGGGGACTRNPSIPRRHG